MLTVQARQESSLSFNLMQRVDEATHNQGGSLDLVITRPDFDAFGLKESEASFYDQSLVTCCVPATQLVIVTVPVESCK